MITTMKLIQDNIKPIPPKLAANMASEKVLGIYKTFSVVFF